MHSIKLLNLPQELEAPLLEAGISSLAQLQDSQSAQLQHAGLSHQQALQSYQRLEQWSAKRFRNEVLLPYLPQSCQFVECAYLNLTDDLLVRLEAHSFEYLYQLALRRRASLLTYFHQQDLNQLQQALKEFISAYREGEIVLKIEEQHDD